MSFIQSFGKTIGRDFENADDLMTWIVFGDEPKFGRITSSQNDHDF